MNNINITKKTGEKVAFNPLKLKQSLIRSGASMEDTNYITSQVCSKIVDGMSTHKIYRLAYELLRKKSGKVAGRYKLKKAIFELGPTGYPFEKLVSKLIASKGFETTSGITMDGCCVKHEVDVYAKNNSKVIFVECKFHNDARKKSDVKVSLYVKSRFEDLKSRYKNTASEIYDYEGWLVTNTRFTEDATQFGSCSGLKLISWNYPEKGNLRQMIDESGFHPITSMRTITKKEIAILLEKNIVLCREIENNKGILSKMEINERRISKIIIEANQIVES